MAARITLPYELLIASQAKRDWGTACLDLLRRGSCGKHASCPYDHSAQKDLTGYGWRATAAKGKHGIEVMCAAHDNPVSDECETITVRLMDETLSRLND
jgi:hypothetical protein